MKNINSPQPVIGKTPQDPTRAVEQQIYPQDQSIYTNPSQQTTMAMPRSPITSQVGGNPNTQMSNI